MILEARLSCYAIGWQKITKFRMDAVDLTEWMLKSSENLNYQQRLGILFKL